MFCFIVMPMSQLGLLEALSLGSILCQLLLGLLAAFLPDLIGFKGSLRELTCSHDANMRHWETAGFIPLQLGICRKHLLLRKRGRDLKKKSLTFSRDRNFCQDAITSLKTPSIHFSTLRHLAILLKESEHHLTKRNTIS